MQNFDKFDFNIDEYIQNPLTYGINEELSISNDVKEISEKLINELINISNNYEYTYNGNYYIKNINNIQYNLFDTDFTIICVIIKFPDEFDYSTINEVDFISSAQISNKILSLNIVLDEFNFSKNSIYHEVLHIYQYSKSKHIYETNEFYIKATNILKEECDKQSLKYKCALAIYSSFDFEQDAMIHGLYSELVSEFKSKECTLEDIKKFQEYKLIENMQYVIKNIDEFDNKINIKTIFGISKDKVYKLLLNKSGRFYHKFVNLVKKINKDNNINESGLINYIAVQRFLEKHKSKK